MQPGDKVRTRDGEIGWIKEKARSHLAYDWWVTIRFRSRGQDFTTNEPYLESELTVLEDGSEDHPVPRDSPSL